jgi:hypothetical protein
MAWHGTLQYRGSLAEVWQSSTVWSTYLIILLKPRYVEKTRSEAALKSCWLLYCFDIRTRRVWGWVSPFHSMLVQKSSPRLNGVLLLAIPGCAVSHAEMALDHPALLDAILCLAFHV